MKETALKERTLKRLTTDHSIHLGHGPASPRRSGRFPRTYAAWWARLAAPGSRFAPAPTPAPLLCSETATGPAASVERRTA